MTFVSRKLKPDEIQYGTVEKDILALLEFLDVCYVMPVSREINCFLDIRPFNGWSNRSVAMRGSRDGPRGCRVGL